MRATFEDFPIGTSSAVLGRVLEADAIALGGR